MTIASTGPSGSAPQSASIDETGAGCGEAAAFFGKLSAIDPEPVEIAIVPPMTTAADATDTGAAFSFLYALFVEKKFLLIPPTRRKTVRSFRQDQIERALIMLLEASHARAKYCKGRDATVLEIFEN